MKIAFLSETQYQGKWPVNFPNSRTEIAWQIALDADHFPVLNYEQIHGYDWVMLILPKGGVGLNSEGIRIDNSPNRYSELYKQNFVETLKKQNRKVAYIQEGPTWYVNDFNLTDQFNFYNQVAECDVIFAHNQYDTNWYRGCFPGKKVTTIPTLIIEELVRDFPVKTEDKTIIGGNMCRWYGGFQSYLVAQEFNTPVYVHTSHASQAGEDQILNVLPRMLWVDWMKTLSSFKYAVHLMPTVAAGTFSLNCGYFGIPCIGNKNVDTQRICFPTLSVDPEDIEGARKLAQMLKNDPKEYEHLRIESKARYKHAYGIDHWKSHMVTFLEENL